VAFTCRQVACLSAVEPLLVVCTLLKRSAVQLEKLLISLLALPPGANTHRDLLDQHSLQGEESQFHKSIPHLFNALAPEFQSRRLFSGRSLDTNALCIPIMKSLYCFHMGGLASKGASKLCRSDLVTYVRCFKGWAGMPRNAAWSSGCSLRCVVVSC